MIIPYVVLFSGINLNHDCCTFGYFPAITIHMRRIKSMTFKWKLPLQVKSCRLKALMIEMRPL